MSTKKKSSGLSSIIAIVVVVAVIAVAGFVAKAAISKLVDSPKSVVQQLEDSYNDRSIKECIECFDPNTQSLVDGVLGIAEYVVGEEGLLDMAEGLLQISQYIDDEDLEPYQESRLELKVTDVDKDGDTAIVYLNVKLYSGDELICDEPAQLPTVKVDGKWYIDGSYITSEIFSELM